MLRRRVLAACALLALALPAQAAAHGRSAIVALDYRLTLDRVTLSLPGVHVRILDGDRDLDVSVSPGVDLLVRGELDEPLLRIDARGVWVNASSPTATSDGLVPASLRGWVRVSGGNSIVWHDHRLAPPPSSTVGPDGAFDVPIVLDGRRAAIAGTFYRVARPSGWPWLIAALALGAGIVLATRRPSFRGRVTISLGLTAGLAALATVTTFAVRDAPSGGVAWLQIGTGFALAIVLGALLLRVHGRSRIHAAGIVGAVAAAASLSALSVFWHGVVISMLPGSFARLFCGLALVLGVAAAASSCFAGVDKPLRKASRR